MKIFQFPKKIINFFKEVREEMGKVSWPSKKDVFKNTLIVIGISVILAIFLGGFDFIFTNLLKKFVF
jgi:preprotein translocase subunit SecE